ncbi:MAG: hypothetical protein SGI99_18080 [Pseudomonadota bacterium]|nr:hypothetical protein [Pseudomonadota bacterium]
MKTSVLTNAVIVGIAMAAGVVGDAHALNLNPLGTGQVLIFPYYTVNAGNQTLISVVNRTERGKAIRVRLREGHNARAILDFNLYLSPFDVWTASVFSLADDGPNNPGNLVTTDNSCTVPRVKGNTALPQLSNGNRYTPFPNYRYTGASNDAGPNTLDRTREGYFEMIEMGEVVDRERTSLTAITHDGGGVPNNCMLVHDAWLPLGAASADATYWSVNALVDMNPPQGGLFGTASIVDALEGTMMSYSAEAIDGFSDIVQHVRPGEPSPSLSSARTTPETAVARVFHNGEVVTSSYPLSQAIDAVSALFVQDEIDNEFITSASVGGASEWVVTFPTKYAYVDQELVGATAIAPFTQIFPRTSSSTNTGSAAVDSNHTVFNREEGPNATFCTDPFGCCDFICPPSPPVVIPRLGWSSNVVTFNQLATINAGSNILGSRLVMDTETIDVGVFDGWAIYRFYDATGTTSGSAIQFQRMRPDQSGGRWDGVPVTGFLAVSYTNGQLTPGVLSNYAAAFKHRGSNHYEMTP